MDNRYGVKVKISFTILVAIIVASSLFTSTCFRNKKATQDRMFMEFSDYDLVIREFNASLRHYNVANFSVFNERLQMYNISTVYVEPYTILQNVYIFYYQRNEAVYRTFIKIVKYDLCQYRLKYY